MTAPAPWSSLRRSPFFGPGLILLLILVTGWAIATFRPFSFGWLGNPRGDGYLAAGCLIIDLTMDPESAWSIRPPETTRLDDLSELDYSGYREEAAWYRVRLSRDPEIGGYHFLAAFPVLIGLHVFLWGSAEGCWRHRMKKRVIAL